MSGVQQHIPFPAYPSATPVGPGGSDSKTRIPYEADFGDSEKADFSALGARLKGYPCETFAGL